MVRWTTFFCALVFLAGFDATAEEEPKKDGVKTESQLQAVSPNSSKNESQLAGWEKEVLRQIELLENLELLDHMELVGDLPALNEQGVGR